ncbi:helix-turn-helix domain-containing protein [Sphaerisporangium sp. NPDC051017]|uniref:TetR/AcrR family transcriptional regulator n=1 Tax=Sphaerisporangium sp. NPDC051017 TaxID=3154636 RepID=UPI003419A210
MRATQRADAIRSRARIIAAARVVIDRDGPAVSLDRIAREAGVGSATLYRHFPTRAHLLGQVFSAKAGTLAEYVEELGRNKPTSSALRAWAHRLVQEAITDRGLGAALLSAGLEPVADSQCRGRVVDATRQLLALSPVAQSLAPGVTAEDFVDVATSVAIVVDEDVVRGLRLMDLWLTGVAPGLPPAP